MNAPSNIWSEFFADFGSAIDTWIEEAPLKCELAEKENELARVKGARPFTLAEELAEAERRVMADIDAKEAETARRQIRGNGDLAHYLENWRANATSSYNHVPLTALHRDTKFLEHETENLLRYSTLRKLMNYVFTVQRERLSRGEITDDGLTMAPAVRDAKMSELEAQIGHIKTQLAQPRFSPAWRYSADRKTDFLEVMLREYMALQSEADFPLAPEHRWKVAPSNGGVTTKDHPDAAWCTLTGDRLLAWHRLMKYIEERSRANAA